jgi:integrase
LNDQIKVRVIKYPTRENLVMRYVDPLTGKQVTRSTRTSKRREAERAAAKWEAELREGRYQRQSRITWVEFRERYEIEKLGTLAFNTRTAWDSAANHLERVVSPKHLASIDASVVSQFQAKLLAEGMRSTTLASHLRSLRAALNWAERQGLVTKAPRVEMPKLTKGARTMRGRPITTEEFERMLAAVPAARTTGTSQRAEDRCEVSIVRRQGDLAKWRRFLRGLWLSGLRLGEALQLSWDADAAIAVHLGGRYPMLRIWGEAQKSKRDALLPIAPEFAELLLATPEASRRGLVFGIEGLRRGQPLDTQRASRTIAKIGEAALVVVDPNVVKLRVDKKTGEVHRIPKCTTAHDLRRAFGTRWSKRVMPAMLQKLMRHASIETTMKFYVEHNADDISADLWRWQGSILGSIRPETESAASTAAESEDHKSLSAYDV